MDSECEWSLDEVVAIDFETTGTVKGQENLPWQIGCARMVNGRLSEEETLSLYLKVPEHHHFNPYTPGRWAEMREILFSCNSLIEEWPTLKPWLTNSPLAAHNVPVERTMLNRYFPMHQFGPWIDTLRIARQAFPTLKDYTLTALIEQFSLQPAMLELCPDLSPHDAKYDAVGCACLLKFIRSLPGWREAAPSTFFCK